MSFISPPEQALILSKQFEALRRVHLIPSESPNASEENFETINENVFRNLDSPVSEGGENFSTGCENAPNQFDSFILTR